MKYVVIMIQPTISETTERTMILTSSDSKIKAAEIETRKTPRYRLVLPRVNSANSMRILSEYLKNKLSIDAAARKTTTRVYVISVQ